MSFHLRGSARWAASLLLVAVLCADEFDLWRRRGLLLFFFNMRKDGAQVLVLRDRSMGDALSVRIEDATGQCDAFGTHLDAPIRHLVHIHIFANKAARHAA